MQDYSVLININSVIEGADLDFTNRYQDTVSIDDLKEPLVFIIESISNHPIDQNIKSAQELADLFYSWYMGLIKIDYQNMAMDYDDYIEHTRDNKFYPTEKGEFYISRIYYWLANLLLTNNYLPLNSPYSYVISIERASNKEQSWVRNQILFYTLFVLDIGIIE